MSLLSFQKTKKVSPLRRQENYGHTHFYIFNLKNVHKCWTDIWMVDVSLSSAAQVFVWSFPSFACEKYDRYIIHVLHMTATNYTLSRSFHLNRSTVQDQFILHHGMFKRHLWWLPRKIGKNNNKNFMVNIVLNYFIYFIWLIIALAIVQYVPQNYCNSFLLFDAFYTFCVAN